MATISQPDASLIPTPGQEADARFRALFRSTFRVAVTLLVVFVVWQGSISLFDLKPFVIPTPASVVAALVDDWPKLGAALAYTLQSTVLGLAISFVGAVMLASLFAFSDDLAKAFMPMIIAIRTAPVLAIAPLLIMIFGRGQATSIAVVIVVSFFPILVNASRGLRSTSPATLELMHVCGATWLQTFFKARVPNALPFIFTGMRTAATSALLSAMLAEWLSGAPGIGTLILEAGSFRNLPLMWAGVALTMAVAFVLFASTVRIERSFVT